MNVGKIPALVLVGGVKACVSAPTVIELPEGINDNWDNGDIRGLMDSAERDL